MRRNLEAHMACEREIHVPKSLEKICALLGRTLRKAEAQRGRDRDRQNAAPRARTKIDAGWREVAEKTLGLVKRFTARQTDARANPKPH
jgi:hypothetical protein